MRRRKGLNPAPNIRNPHPFSAIGPGILCIAFLLHPFSGPAEPREVTVKILAVDDYGRNAAWEKRAEGLFDAAAKEFRDAFGIALTAHSFERWTAPHAWDSLETLSDLLRSHASRGHADVLAAMTSRPGESGDYAGYSLFREGIIVLRDMGDTSTATRILKHEIAHLFGAVHIDDSQSLMDVFGRGGGFDDMNAGIIRLHRDRTFNGVDYPTPHRHVPEVAALLRAVRISLRESAKASHPALQKSLAEIHLALAHLHLESRNHEEALAECRAALETHPSCPEPLNLMGIALRRSGRFDEAVEMYGRYMDIKPGQAVVHYNIGIALAGKGDADAALAAYETAVAIRPNFAEAHMNIGELYLHRDRIGEAEAKFREAVFHNPRWALAHANLADVLLRKEEFEETALRLRTAHDLGYVTAKTRLNLSAALLRQGDLDSAVSEAEKALILDPGLAEARNNLGIAYAAKGLWEDAVCEFEESIRLDPRGAGAYINLGHLHFQAGRLEDALRFYLKGAEIEPEDGLLHNNIAVVYFRRGDLRNARKHAAEALALGFPVHPDFLRRIEDETR